ncbi:MAG: 6-phosphofructokinase [Rubrivivax sp.]|nr:6-phosphofructokinase [Rubrivivax sp.]
MVAVKRIGVLTSGGDAPGMNAAVRAVVRTGLRRGAEVWAITEGYKGMVEGGNAIRLLSWDAVSGILHVGGTVIGTARCAEFRERSGRRQAAANLVAVGIDRLVVIGGDGSLTGASLFCEEWPDLLVEAVAAGMVTPEQAAAHPALHVVGLVGSIDNDMVGTDMTIGADTALHRITQALDDLASTAASHQRSFVVEVMGRHCGYLALRGAIAGGADWVFIPESPPPDGWEDHMCEELRLGRLTGRRDSIVIVAEGAVDRHGKPITSAYVRQVLEDRLHEDTRVTVLGHVQRGGSPSAFDRCMSSLLGHAAVEALLAADAVSEPVLMGFRNNRVTRLPLMPAVEQTRAVTAALVACDFDRAIHLRSPSFQETRDSLATLMRARPRVDQASPRPLRIALMHAGGAAPGMNTAARAAVRTLLDRGHRPFGVRYGMEGFLEHDIVELDWRSVSGWGSRGGAELGTTRHDLAGKDLYAIARTIEQERFDGVLMIGGYAGYEEVHRMFMQRANFPAFKLPMVCLPCSINNNLPGSETSVGADSALNAIVQAVDKIKQSAADERCFVVEVMGRYCGYLALMGGLATGAEHVLLHEEGITLDDLRRQVDRMAAGFAKGKRLSLVLRSERANDVYTTGFITALFAEEGRGRFSVRQAILGHLQQGCDPSPFDRNLATRLVTRCVDRLIEQAGYAEPDASFIGVAEGHVQFTSFDHFTRLVDEVHQRPRQQWWLGLRDILDVLARQAGAP